MNLYFYLFDDFETLDLFGPVEVLCRIPDTKPHYISLKGGIIESAQKTRIETKSFETCLPGGIFVIPGGRGTRNLVNDENQLKAIKMLAQKSKYVLSICTGSAVLAKCGLLENRNATSNKNAFEWVRNCGNSVNWQKEPRYCKDENYYTSAGVSAGIDMAFAFVEDYAGKEISDLIKKDIEY